MRYAYPSGSRPLEGYTIKRGVGRGGFGEVYFAVSDAGKEVALKLIRRNLDVELRGVTQCLNLKHQNLIALYDIRTDEHEDRWVVMEYVSGESLDEAIEKHPQGMPLELAMHWFTGIATGVAYLHDHGIVHRDLKPANLFMDEGTVKIGDYGLSKFISCSRRSGQTESVGTVHYMAPEIGNGRYGKEIDTYALGIILYEMLTGHVPFEGESVGEVLMKHLTAEPDLNVLDEPYRGIVAGAMAKDPEVRIKSVAAMLDRLPSSVRPVGAVPMPNGRSAEGPVVLTVDEEPAEAASLKEDDEPILAALRSGWYDLERRFDESDLHPLLKSMIVIALVLVFVSSGIPFLGLLLPAAFLYLIYRTVRAIVVGPSRKRVAAKPVQGVPSRSESPGISSVLQERIQSETARATQEQRTKQKTKQFSRQDWRQQLQEHLAAKTMRQRMTELVGGMLVATAVASIGSLAICLVSARGVSMELYVWMTLVASLASWAVMIPTRLAEGKFEDQAPMRFVQLVSGALVGVMAWGIAEALVLSMPWSNIGIGPGSGMMDVALGFSLERSTLADNAAKLVRLPLQVYAAYFAFLFALLAWWRQAEVTRRSRVSLWSVVWCGFVAWLLHFVWWFPQPLGLLLAAVIAFTVQFSSVWIPPSRRQALAEGEEVG